MVFVDQPLYRGVATEVQEQNRAERELERQLVEQAMELCDSLQVLLQIDR